MQVDITETGEIEHPLRNDAPVPDDHYYLRLKIGELRAKLRIVLDGFGLSNRQSQFQRGLLHWRGHEFKPATFWPIRLRHHQANDKSTLDEPEQRRHGEAGSTAKHEIERLRHRQSSARGICTIERR